MVVGGAIVSMRGVGFPGHVHQPDVTKRREHGGARPDDDVVAAIAQGEPVPVALPLVPPEVQTDPVAECRPKRCRRRGDGCRFGHHDDRTPPMGETSPDGVDGDGLLILGRRPQDERPRRTPDRFEQVRVVPLSLVGNEELFSAEVNEERLPPPFEPQRVMCDRPSVLAKGGLADGSATHSRFFCAEERCCFPFRRQIAASNASTREPV